LKRSSAPPELPGPVPRRLYDDELFTDERGSAVVYVPVADAPSA
jgi:hypothetical protein